MPSRVRQGRLQDVDRYMTAWVRPGARPRLRTVARLLAPSQFGSEADHVHRLVAGMQDMIQRTLGPSVFVELVGASGLWTALVDSSQLENALLNRCRSNQSTCSPQEGGPTACGIGEAQSDRRARVERPR
jgi:hypothetical protein